MLNGWTVKAWEVIGLEDVYQFNSGNHSVSIFSHNGS